MQCLLLAAILITLAAIKMENLPAACLFHVLLLDSLFNPGHGSRTYIHSFHEIPWKCMVPFLKFNFLENEVKGKN
jgi:hypothetical protein